MAKPKLGPISSQFVSHEVPKGRFCLGKYMATALSGFLAGVIVTCLVWLLVIEAFFK
jgi:hypothetical protein